MAHYDYRMRARIDRGVDGQQVVYAQMPAHVHPAGHPRLVFYDPPFNSNDQGRGIMLVQGNDGVFYMAPNQRTWAEYVADAMAEDGAALAGEPPPPGSPEPDIDMDGEEMEDAEAAPDAAAIAAQQAAAAEIAAAQAEAAAQQALLVHQVAQLQVAGPEDAAQHV